MSCACTRTALADYTKVNQVVANPAAYGFESCVTPGQPPFKCANPDSCVFWDGIHPTKAMHALIAREALAALAAAP